MPLHTNLSIRVPLYIGQLNRNNHKKSFLVTSMQKIHETYLQQSSTFLKAVVFKFEVYQNTPSLQLFFKDFHHRSGTTKGRFSLGIIFTCIALKAKLTSLLSKIRLLLFKILNRTENKNKKHKLPFILLIRYQQNWFKHVKHTSSKKIKGWGIELFYSLLYKQTL